VKILPYLSPSELNLIWNYLTKSKGFGLLSEHVKAKVNLYQAVGAMDYSKILEITNSFLGNEMILPVPESQYFLSTAMWANLMLDKPDEALKLWQRYQNENDPPVMLRFLSSLATDRIHEK